MAEGASATIGNSEKSEWFQVCVARGENIYKV